MYRREGEEEMVQRASIELKRVVSLCLLWESFVAYFTPFYRGVASRSKLLPSWLCTLHLLKRKCRGGVKLDPDGRESVKSHRVVAAALLFCSVSP